MCEGPGSRKEAVMVSNALVALALLCVLWGIVSSIKIVLYLTGRGVRINYIFMRVLVLKYISQYHDMTATENGRPGPWFYSYITSMLLALVFAVTGLSLR
jgi:hypothetical protein